MEMDCIPAGMELFPAFDEEQFEFIKRIIDDCDYYVLMIGGRYGSTTPEGLSFTEKEYDYAVEKGIKVIALIHESPESIASGKTEQDPVLQGRLKEFREKVKKGRLVKFWSAADQLPGILVLSLMKTIKTYPALGWVRGGISTSKELLEEINELRKENEILKNRVLSVSNSTIPTISDLATLEHIYIVRVTFRTSMGAPRLDFSLDLPFSKYFSLIAPHLMEHPTDSTVKSTLSRRLVSVYNAKANVHTASINDEDYQTLKLQFKAFDLVDLNYTTSGSGDKTLVWTLTDKGLSTLMSLKVVRNALADDQVIE